MNGDTEANRPKENRMNRTLGVCIALGAWAAVMLGGCASGGPGDTEQPAPAPAGTALAAQLGPVRQQAESLAAISRQLPGGTDLEHRFIVSDALGAIASATRMLSEDGKDGALQQQLAIIESVRVRLSAADINVNSDALIDTALRAAVSALAAIRAQRYDDDASLKSAGQRLDTKVQELDMVRGPMHRLVATETVNLMAQSIWRMITILEERIAPPPFITPLETAPAAPAPPAPQPPAEMAPTHPPPAEPAGPQP